VPKKFPLKTGIRQHVPVLDFVFQPFLGQRAGELAPW
jgi:hypothetical protein